MKPLLLGAVLALLWLLLGCPFTVPSTAVAPLLQPVTMAFLLGALTRPHLTGRRWTR
ncbi:MULTISPECIES: hypothetical protein [unclassified Streptomyces]|uniref:hypothetical protein n=1 Tax=unclassified Streptomyces TaxID=2593676 RepID=UPI002FF0506C